VRRSASAHSRAAVAAFHKAALAAGGKDEGAVGPRGFWPNAYAGYVRDLDGASSRMWQVSRATLVGPTSSMNPLGP